jgi:DNA processing protein
MLNPTTFANLLLLRLPETGAASYWQLIEAFGSPSAVLNQSSAALQQRLKPAALAALLDYQRDPHNSELALRLAADQEYLAAQPDLQLLSYSDAEYPRLLQEIPKPPPLLFVRGNLELLNLPQVALVGSRNPTQAGSENAERFAQYLAANGFVITSGLALGVDAAGHRGALKGQGKTIAVMGTGIDRIYPAAHKSLAQQILAEGGALVSEFPLGTAAQAANFPQRNRIISGLSCGTLVIEAALKSGSLITAAFALQHNREVFAIPGSIHNPLARGCHQLIRQGATLVETAQDIIEQLDGMLSFKRSEVAVKRKPKSVASAPMPGQTLDLLAATEAQAPELTAEEQALFDAIGYDPVSLDQLLERVALPIGELMSLLMMLEIKGVILQAAGLYQRL